MKAVTSKTNQKSIGSWFLNLKEDIKNWYFFDFKKGQSYSAIFTPQSEEHETDGLLRVHGFGLANLGGRHQFVKCVNLDNGRSFNAKVCGMGSRYRASSKQVCVLTYDQRCYLGLERNARKANLVIYKDRRELSSP